jgi:RNase P subunit RPR2
MHSPTEQETKERLNTFLERYALECEAREDPRRRYVKYVGEVSIADAVRMLQDP